MQLVYIYAIKRVETGHAYIGSTITPKGRWIRHRCQLKLNKHHCHHLQRAWNKYGKDAFVYEILAQRECIDRADRLAYELSWISDRGHYNVLISTEDKSHFTKSDEAKAALSKALIEKKATNPEYAAFLKQRGQEISAFMQSDEGRANMGKHTKRRWQDPEERKRLRAGLERRWEDPAEHEKHSQKIAAAHGTPEMREMHRANTKALWETAEYRDKVSKKAVENRWNDPEAKARQAEKMRAYHAARRAKLSVS